MFQRKHLLKVTILCVCLSGIILSLKASYYLDTLFPIGLTGINPTGATPPYGNPGLDWKWTPEESQYKNEQDLIFDLGINCIGCQDAWARYIGYVNPHGIHYDNYLHKVCKHAIDKNMTVNYNSLKLNPF